MARDQPAADPAATRGMLRLVKPAPSGPGNLTPHVGAGPVPASLLCQAGGGLEVLAAPMTRFRVARHVPSEVAGRGCPRPCGGSAGAPRGARSKRGPTCAGCSRTARWQRSSSWLAPGPRRTARRTRPLRSEVPEADENGIAVQPDDKILAVGGIDGSGAAVWRLGTDGQPDLFGPGGGGVATTSGQFWDITLVHKPDGSDAFVIAGRSFPTAGGKGGVWTLWRYFY